MNFIEGLEKFDIISSDLILEMFNDFLHFQIIDIKALYEREFATQMGVDIEYIQSCRCLYSKDLDDILGSIRE